MADRTWNGSTNGSFTDPLNWETGVAVDGDTIKVFGHSVSMAFPIPTSNQPGAGTYHFSIDKTFTADIASFINGATIGNVIVSDSLGLALCSIACNNVLALGGNFICTGAFTIASGVTINGGTFTTNSTEVDVICSNDGGMAWVGANSGSFNAAGNTIAHSVVAGASIDYTTASNLDLGGDASGLGIEINAIVAMIDDVTCGDVSLTSGSFDLGDNLLTTSGFTHTGGTLTTTTDYGGTINASGTRISDTVAINWINIIDGADGGGNSRLKFPQHAINRAVAQQMGIVFDTRVVFVPDPPNYTIGLNFRAEYDITGSFPPDTQGAVGPNHIVTALNGNFAIYDKTDGTVLDSRQLTSFFSSIGGGGFEYDAFDPRVVYDPNDERFYLIAADGRSVEASLGSNLLIAVSANSDPTDGWTSFIFDTQELGTEVNTHWLDFPIIGYNRDVVTVVGKLFDKDALPALNSFTMVYVFPKSDLLLPTPNIDNAVRIEPEQSSLTFRNTPIFDPYNSMPHLITGIDSSFYVDEVVEDGGGGYNVTNTSTVSRSPDNDGDDGRQPNGVQDLHHATAPFQGQSPMRVGDFIYGAWSTMVDGDTAIAFFKLNAITQRLELITTIHYSGMDMIYNSVAVNNRGRIVIGFTGTGPSTYPNSYCVVGRLTGNQPPYAGAVFSDPIQLSFSTQTHLRIGSGARNRWGDYSSTVVDPSDNDHFWTFQEYGRPGSDTGYYIRATQIILD